jgi:hypothetical protein
MRSYILIGLLSFLSSLQLWASDRHHNENDPERYIKLTHNRSGDTVILKTGDALRIMFMNKRFRGKIESIWQHSFVMDNKEFDFALFDCIDIIQDLKGIKTVLYASIGADVGIAIPAALCFREYKQLSESRDYHEKFQMMAISNALRFIFFMLIFLIFVLAMKNKPTHYDLRKKWRIESVNKN